MKTENLFDTKLDLLKGRIPKDIHEAAVYVTDTLDICWAASQSVFEKHATPEHALAIYDRVISQISATK